MSIKPATPTSNGIDRSRLLMAMIASVAAAALANVVMYFIVGLLYDAPEGFAPLTLGPILLFTIVGTSAGALLFWFLSGRSANPIRTYRLIALVALILSIIPNIVAYFNPSMFPMPGGTPMAFLVLILFHIVAAVVSVMVLTTMVARR
jgi:hypothetical protein